MLYSPMEQFEIYPVLSYSLTINNVIFYLYISSFIIFFLNSISYSTNLVCNWWGILTESLYMTIHTMVENYISSKFTMLFPLIYTVFHLILFSNLLGLVPYSSTSTVEIVITLSISLTLLAGILILGILNHRFLLLAQFLPAGTPLGLMPLMVFLEVLSYFTKTISLGLRLAVNMITGHILAKVCVGFIWTGYLKGTSIIILTLPLALLTLFLSLEILISYLQAYIFTFITCITVKDIA